MDPGFWEELAGLDPQSVCRRSGAVVERNGYRLRVFDGDYFIQPSQRRISMSRVGADPGRVGPGVSDTLEMVIVHYLINARDIPPADEWVGLQELGTGGQFFVSHVPDYGRILPLFSASPEAVTRSARAMGGRLLDTGDVSVAFQMLPRVPVGFVYWAASEEFPANVSVLFDRTVEQHLPLDVLSAAIQAAIGRLAAATREEGG